jgi:hypothetical protein
MTFAEAQHLLSLRQCGLPTSKKVIRVIRVIRGWGAVGVPKGYCLYDLS